MTIAEYKVHFHALFRYSYASIPTKFKKIWMFIKGLDVFIWLDISYGCVWNILLEYYGSC